MSTAFDSLSWRGGVSVTISIDDRLVGKSSSDWSSQRCWNDSSALLARLNCLLSSSFQSKVSCSLCLFLSFWLSLATKPTASATTTTTTTALYCLCLSIRVVWIPGDDTTVSPPRHGFVILPAPIYGSPSRDPSILLDLFLFYLSFLFSVYLFFLLFFTSVWHFRFFFPPHHLILCNPQPLACLAMCYWGHPPLESRKSRSPGVVVAHKHHK